MERLDFKNIETKCSPDYYDIRRVALMMYDNKKLLFDIIQEITDGTDDRNMSNSAAGAIIGLESHNINIPFGSIVGAACGSVLGNVCNMSSSEDTEEKVKDILINLRKANKRGDKDSANKVFAEFMNCTKESAVLCLMECLSSISSEKREKIVGHIIGNYPENEHSVAIDIMKRGDEQRKNKDQYAYYVCFRNCRNREKRIVKFENHTSASIYVMYVIDRYVRRNNNGPIDVLKNLDLLQMIHSKIFTGDGKVKGLGNDVFLGESSLYKRIEKNRLSQYYSDINNTVSQNIHEWDFVLPYRCDSSTPIRLNPDLITVPKELIPENWIIKT